MIQPTAPTPGPAAQGGGLGPAAAPQGAAPQGMPGPAQPQPGQQSLRPPMDGPPIDRSLRGNVSAAREHSNRQGSTTGDANPGEQAEFERVMIAVEKIMYGDDKANAGIVNGIDPRDKIGSVAQTAAILLKQIDDKVDMDEVVIPEVTMEVTDRVIDIAENAKGLEFSEAEQQAIWGATWELVMGAFGVDPDDFAELTDGMSDDDLAGYETQYNDFLSGAG